MARKTNPPENANRILAAATEAVNRNVGRAKGQRIQQKFTSTKGGKNRGYGPDVKGPTRRQSGRIERAGLASPLARKGGRLTASTAKGRQAGGRAD